jgi:hypothetical protein
MNGRNDMSKANDKQELTYGWQAAMVGYMLGVAPTQGQRNELNRKAQAYMGQAPEAVAAARALVRNADESDYGFALRMIDAALSA